MMLLNTSPVLGDAELTDAIGRARHRDMIGRSSWSRWMIKGYRIRALRPVIRAIIAKLEGGAMHSQTLRQILKEQYDVDLGMYSYGPIVTPGCLPPGTVIGRFCSFGPEIEVIRRNHPTKRMSLHPLFYDHRVGVFESDKVIDPKDNPLHVENDVWVGLRAVILPNCRKIGNGSTIGAGAIVTKDVPSFSIVAGNPAKVIGYRFEPAICKAIEETKWWSHSLTTLSPYLSHLSSEPTPEGLTALRSINKNS
jgi:virginiamycin A acetyltransferase